MPKVAVITGAGSGIGAASVILFSEKGYNVLACDVNLNNEQFKRLKNVECLVLDVTNEPQVANAMDTAVKKWGSLDCVFANAGIAGPPSLFTDFDSEDFDQILKVNVNGVFYALKHGAIAMQKLRVTNGSLISTASVAGIRSGAGSAPYSASKAAVISLTKTICNQLTGTGIRVNCICPGLIETGMTKPLFDVADDRGNRSRIGQINPMQRYGVAREIATVAYFLASDDASYINGQAIAVDGGLSSSHPVAFKKPGKVSL